MENESKIPELVLDYAKRLAQNGHKIRWVTKQDVDRLREDALRAIKNYREANLDLQMYDKEQEEAKQWLISIGVDFNEKRESCETILNKNNGK